MDIEKLLKQVFGDNDLNEVEVTTGKDFVERYEEEEISNTDPKIAEINKIYRKIIAMRGNEYNYYVNGDRIFYNQVQYIKDLEDNYDKLVTEINNYYCVINTDYTGLTLNQFREYITWRTNVRKGIVKTTKLDYINIYINEVINEVYTKDDLKKIEILVSFWSEYRKIDAKIDDIILKAIKGIYALSKINKPFDEISHTFPVASKREDDINDILKDIYTNKLNFLNDISKYKILKSKFMETEYSYMIGECLDEVITKISDVLKDNRILLKHLLVCEIVNSYFQPLRSYNLYPYRINKEKSRIVKIDTLEEWVFDTRFEYYGWRRYVKETYNGYNDFFGFILKYMEYAIRNYLGYRSFKEPVLNIENKYIFDKTFQKNVKVLKKIDFSTVILNTVNEYMKKSGVKRNVFKIKKEGYQDEVYEEIEVKFNVDEFENIRKKARDTQKSLIIDEEIDSNNENIENEKILMSVIPEKAIVQASQMSNPSSEFEIFYFSLSDLEKQTVKLFLDQKDVTHNISIIAHNNNVLPEVLISNINDKAIEAIGDNLIDFESEKVYEDYENKMKEIFKEE